jgi:hypothetical protein
LRGLDLQQFIRGPVRASLLRQVVGTWQGVKLPEDLPRAD